jgi:hypothetical protein
MSQTELSTPIQAVRSAAIVNHVRQNNVAYLLGVLIAHTLGITERLLAYGQGMC